FTSKGISNPHPEGPRPGMSTYLALTFGTLLSSQGTDASFEPPSSGPTGRFVLSCFQLIRRFPPRFPEFHSSDFPNWPGPLSATASTLAHSGCSPEIHAHPVGADAERPKLMGFE
ncbi:hypothetical protein PUR71_10655, partial [Streptomyces sp. SP17BM10]|uniref:hypothetical protein n=1 Tax=Streptomyces sp. SP17BM10 TaxID=3002530 RepID=UPI002E7AA96B